MTGAVKWIRRIGFVVYLLLCLGGGGGIVMMALFFFSVSDLPRVPHPLGRIIETPPTEIFASTGERIMVIGGRESVPLSRVSPYFLQAVVATEDHRFWEHHGVDKIRLLKAFWIAVSGTERIQGASTLTQQLSKNLFFSFERSYLRKYRELLVALQIEARYTKEEILEAYVNQIAFGMGAYGVEQASRTFFDKPASALSLAEAALIAGLPQAPSSYNPFRHLDRAQKRQRIVLKRMAAVGYIRPEESARAMDEPIQLSARDSGKSSGSYFLDFVLETLEDRYGPETLYHGGLKVTTTLDPRMQGIARDAVQEGLKHLDELMGLEGETEANAIPQGALAVIEARSGAVKALMGGRRYELSEFNRACKSSRQPGSGFKPFLYYTALEKLGFTPATVVVDQPVRIPVVGAKDWMPRNFSRKHQGPMALKTALIKSVNTIAAQLVQKTGPEAVIATARKCGIRSPLSPVYSVALGSSGVSPLEMASGFATFATGGVYHEPFWIWRVEDALGHILEEHLVSGRRVLDPSLTFQLIDMMRGVVDQGTGSVIRKMGFDLPAAGKTGTTNSCRDAWFTGFTPNLSACAWVGYDNDREMRDKRKVGITGGSGAAPIWAAFMKAATEGDPRRDFPVPDDIHFENADPLTGCRVIADAQGVMPVPLLKGQRLCERGAPLETAGTVESDGIIEQPAANDENGVEEFTLDE